AKEQERVNVRFWEQRQTLVAAEADVKAAIAEQLRDLMNRAGKAGVMFEPPPAKLPENLRATDPPPTIAPTALPPRIGNPSPTETVPPPATLPGTPGVPGG